MAKIYVQLSDSLYLRKIDAQKEYLSLSGGTDVVLNYKYDGSDNSKADVSFYSCNAKVGNQNNYPYHRIARIDLTSENYKDWSTTLYISQGYLGGGFGFAESQ